MLVPRVCAPRVTRCSLGKYWSRDLHVKRLADWLMTGYGHTEFLKSLVTTFNPQEHANLNSYIKLHARVSYTS